MTHPNLARLSLPQQVSELCRAADLIGSTFGQRPLLARAPFGSVNSQTDGAIAQCGMYVDVHWDASVARERLSFAHPGGLQAGDIVLLHWGPGLLADLRVLFSVMDTAGLHAGVLQDDIGPTATKAAAGLPPPPSPPPSASE